MKKYLLVALLFVSCSNTYIRTVKSVHDGDTFYTTDGKAIRLAEIDCPELTQEYGIEARDYLCYLICDKQIELKKIDKDKYGRDVCEVYVDGIWVNRAVILQGLAWAYNNYSSLHKEQMMIRDEHIGLWSQNNPIPPFKFRRDNEKN